jgi:hypothetical protein
MTTIDDDDKEVKYQQKIFYRSIGVLVFSRCNARAIFLVNKNSGHMREVSPLPPLLDSGTN